MAFPNILLDLTGPSVRKLILIDHQTLEVWNDAGKLKGEDRDRLGYKERRFQAILAQILRRRGYQIVVESYYAKTRRWRGHKSCDIYAYNPLLKKEHWIELKSVWMGIGGKSVLQGCLRDLAKMLSGKQQKDLIIFWLAFYTGDNDQYKGIFINRNGLARRTLNHISKGTLKKIFVPRQKGRIPSPRPKIDKLLTGIGKIDSVRAIISIKEWFTKNGGKTILVPISPIRGKIEKDWVKYGIFCGLIK